jgi:predicted glycoside hydrolase/deacetylase ChbG (UPF0249 family)
MKKIIINADDFGLTESTNQGIVAAYSNGLLTSTSLMACGGAFQHAVNLAKKHDIKNVGVHLVLDEETPVAENSLIPSLINPQNKFHGRGSLLLRLLFYRNLSLKEVEIEFRAQIKRCLDSGIKPTHIDGHGHVHVYPRIVDVVISLAKEFSIEKIRIPYEPFSFVGKKTKPGQYLKKSIVSFFSLMNRERFMKAGFKSPDHFFGLSYSGRVDEELLADILRKTPDDAVTEIMTHPGLASPKDFQPYAHWDYHWTDEYLALTKLNKSVFENTHNLKLISSRDL